ncbi:MAG: hypothetical protein WCX83_01945 [Candidatus Cloacimonas sp.]|nr:hypothetical protein [Candidatus Cloacimonadota bacterium]
MDDVKLPRIKNCIALFIAIFSLFACSVNTELRVKRHPVDTKEVQSIHLPFRPEKIACSKLDNRLYVWEAGSNQIHLYQDSKRINTIGGLGFGESNFTKLSDITTTFNGRLLALDSFQKKIKKFDSSGMHLETFALNELNNPTLFDISRDGALYIYDATTNEVVIYDDSFKEIIYRFGKFQFVEPSSISVTRYNVTIYDKKTDTTYIHNSFGKLEEKLEGYWQVDNYLQKYQLSNGIIKHNETSKNLQTSATPKRSFFIKDNLIMSISEREATLSEIIYEKK